MTEPKPIWNLEKNEGTLKVQLIGGPYRGRLWRVLLDGRVIADDLPYEEVKPLILGKISREAFLTRHKGEANAKTR